jgi:hypothetical protein
MTALCQLLAWPFPKTDSEGEEPKKPHIREVRKKANSQDLALPHIQTTEPQDHLPIWGSFRSIKSYRKAASQGPERRGCLHRRRWLTPVILAPWEAEIWRIIVQGQSGQIVHKTTSTK